MKTLFFTIALTSLYAGQAKMMMNSFKKYHPDREITCLTYEDVKKLRYKMQDIERVQNALTPFFLDDLIEKYDCLVRLDADQIITGNLDHVLEGDYDVAVVQNSNPRELKKLKVTVWDIDPLDYANCGFVVVKSKKFIRHWFNLCMTDRLWHYQYREQDILNILINYFNYKVKYLDNSNKWHGLISKQYWNKIILKDDKFILPKNEEWPIDEDKEIICLHWAGGTYPGKMHDLKIRFREEVANKLLWLTKDGI